MRGWRYYFSLFFERPLGEVIEVGQDHHSYLVTKHLYLCVWNFSHPRIKTNFMAFTSLCWIKTKASLLGLLVVQVLRSPRLRLNLPHLIPLDLLSSTLLSHLPQINLLIAILHKIPLKEGIFVIYVRGRAVLLRIVLFVFGCIQLKKIAHLMKLKMTPKLII